MSALLLILALFIILAITAGIIIFQDVNDFGKNFGKSDNLFLLKENNKILAGMQVYSFKIENMTPMDKVTLNEYESMYFDNDIESIRKENYKLIFMNISVFEELNSNISFNDFEIRKELIISLLRTDTPIAMASDYFAEQENINSTIIRQKFIEEYKTDQEFKDYLFILCFGEIFPKRMDIVLKGIRDETIIFYPETPMFQVLKGSPNFLLKSVKNRLQTINTSIENKNITKIIT